MHVKTLDVKRKLQETATWPTGTPLAAFIAS